MTRVLTMLLAGLLALPLAAEAQKTIKVGMPMPLSGPPALFGEPASKGAQMYVDEINAKGGVLGGRKFELIVRDSEADANEAVRVARELILKDNVDFLVGTLTSAEGPAVSVVAKENKIVFIAPIPKTDQLTAADKLHPYVFRVSANTTMEGRSAAEIVAKWPVTRVATMSFDYAYGQDVTQRVRRAPQEGQAVGADRGPAVAQARRAGLQPVHQRPDGEEARGGVLSRSGAASS